MGWWVGCGASDAWNIRRGAITGAVKPLEGYRAVRRERVVGDRVDRVSLAPSALEPRGFDPVVYKELAGLAREGLAVLGDGNRRMYTDLADSVIRGEYRALEGARHSTMTTDRPDAVVQTVRDLIAMAAGEG